MNVINKLGWEIVDGKIIKKRPAKDIELSEIVALLEALENHKKIQYTVLSIICSDIFNYNLKKRLSLKEFQRIYGFLNLDKTRERMLIDRWKNTTVIDRKKIFKNGEIQKDIQLVKTMVYSSKENIGNSKIKYITNDTGFPESKESIYILLFQIDENVVKIFPELEYFVDEDYVLLLNIFQNSKNNKLVNILYINIDKAKDMKFAEFNVYVSSIFRLARNFGAKSIYYRFDRLYEKKSLQLSSAIKSSKITGVNLNVYNIPEPLINKIELWANQVKTVKGTEKLQPLVNMANTCYYDSVLFLILYSDIKFIDRFIFEKSVESSNLEKIQNYLYGMKRYIQGNAKRYDSSVCFRNILKGLEKGERFANRGQQDAAEFLQYIFDIFDVKGSIMRYTTFGRTEDMTLVQINNFIDNQAPIINFTSSFYLSTSKKFETRDFIEKILIDDIEFVPEDIPEKMIQKIEVQKLISAPSIYIFYTQRAHIDRLLTIDIVPNEKLIIGEKEYNLFGVAMHLGTINSGHYNSTFLYKNVWYLFDDIRAEFRTIGTFEEMIKKTNVVKKGILFFYKQ